MENCSTLGNGYYPRRISHRKFMLSFGAIISATIFRNWGNSQMINTPIWAKIKSRCKRTGVWKAKELHLYRRKQSKRVTNCSRHCLLSNWEPRNEAFSTGATTKPPPGPLRAGIEGRMDSFAVKQIMGINTATPSFRWDEDKYSNTAVEWKWGQIYQLRHIGIMPTNIATPSYRNNGDKI